MSRWLSAHIRAVVLAFVLLTVGGLFAALRLPVSLFPHIDFPRVVVSVDAGDRAPDQMQAQVTRPLEQALRSVPAVEQIRSTTSRGAAEVSLNFGWGHDMVAAGLQAQAAIASILPDLPAGTRFSVRRMDPTVFPVLGLALSSSGRDLVSLRRFADLQLRPLIASVPGVAAVDVLGGRQAEIEVIVDPVRLQTLGLSLDDVAKAVAAHNVSAAVGRFEARHRLYLAFVDDRLTGPDDLAGIVVKTGATAGAGMVTLGQVADIRRAVTPEWTRVTAQGRDAVLINVRQNPDAASVALVQAIRAKLAAFGPQVPGDVKIATFYDQSELVSAAAVSVRDAIGIGALLAGLVLFAFLRNLRLMLVTALLLPATLAAACLLLSVMGLSFNIMTLGGMAAAVGLVVDDAVVMLEHLMRRFHPAGEEGGPGERGDPRARLMPAAAEMARPLIGSSLATIVVFAPLAFLGGVTGGFFKALAVTMTAALAISLAFALFVAPVLTRAWLRPRDAEQAERADAAMDRARRLYARVAGGALGRPGLTVLLAAAVLLALGGFAYTRLGSGFLPKTDEGGFILDYKAHPGSALSETDRLLRQVEAIVRATPEVDSYSRRTGYQLGGGLTEADEGDFFIHLRGGARRPIEEVMADIRGRVQAQVPGLDIETAQLMEDLIGDLTAVPQPVEVKLFGSDPAALRRAATAVAGALGKVHGVVEVLDGLRVAGDAVLIEVNRPAAAAEGLDPDAVSKQVQAQLEGSVATTIQQGETGVGVRVWTPETIRGDVESVGRLRLRAPDGHEVPLSRIASVRTQGGQAQITREDLQPFVGVTARLEGRDLGSAMADVRRGVAGLTLPSGVRVEYGGLYAEQQRSFADLAVVFASALLLVSLLLLFLFERWAVVAAILGVVLLAAASVFVGLWVTGTELDISALMGLTMVVGVVTELAVFYFAELPAVGRPGGTGGSTGGAAGGRAQLVEAGQARLRPILMSALIAVLALLPLAFGLGEGASMQKPLAIAIISGLVAGAPLVLLILPALYGLASGGLARERRAAPR